MEALTSELANVASVKERIDAMQSSCVFDSIKLIGSTGSSDHSISGEDRRVISDILRRKLQDVKPPFQYEFDPEIISNSCQVYLGTRRDSGTKVVIKKIRFVSKFGPNAWTDTQADIERYVDQFLMVARLKNPNVVEHFGLELDLQSGGTPEISLVMEYCCGGTLLYRSRCANGLTASDIKRYWRQIISGLACIHQLGICHLDFKGEHILLDKDDNIKIGDFGEMLILQSTTRTHSNEVGLDVGTLRYSAPEMLNPDYPLRGRAADIYSFGCVLIEMITGQVPQYKHVTRGYLMARDSWSLVTFIGNGGGPELPPPGRAPRKVYRMIEQCLRRHPDLRPSAVELKQAMTKWLDTPSQHLECDSLLMSDTDGSEGLPVEDSIRPDEGTKARILRIMQNQIDHVRPRFQYDIIKPAIGEGKHRVYCAIRKDFGTEIAVKKIKFTLEMTSGRIPYKKPLRKIDQLVDQYSAVAKLQHQNIVEHLGLDIHIGDIVRIYLLLEHCAGTLYGKSRATNGLAERDLKRYSHQIIGGLAYIHRQGICHLDIKGENLLLTKKDIIKIADFGETVKLQSSRTRLKEISPDAGTLRYIAPEMINPDLVPRGRAADIYSFGCVLIEMITGEKSKYKHNKRGYLRDDRLLATFISNGGGPEMPLPPKVVPQDVDRMIRECLNREPEMRPSADKLEQDSSGWVDDVARNLIVAT